MSAETLHQPEGSAFGGLVILLVAVILGAVFYLVFFESDTLPTAIKYMMEDDAAVTSTEM